MLRIFSYYNYNGHIGRVHSLSCNEDDGMGIMNGSVIRYDTSPHTIPLAPNASAHSASPASV